jgi:peptide/nickel transport system permease protein
VRQRSLVVRALPPSFGRGPLVLISTGVVAAWAMVAVVAPIIAPYHPLAQDMSMRLSPPDRLHWLGTDALGRDVLSRVLFGSRISLPVGVVAVALAISLGTGIGSVAGHVGGVTDELLMRLTDLMLAFPTVILAMVITAALGPGIRNAVLAIMIAWWPSYARVMRGIVLGVRESEYVEAARGLGASSPRVLFRHILPNSISSIVIMGMMDLGSVMLTFASLSFLGLGPPPEVPEWGLMVAGGRSYLNQWWIGAFPGLAIFSLVVPFNLIGDSVRDWLDPKFRKE